MSGETANVSSNPREGESRYQGCCLASYALIVLASCGSQSSSGQQSSSSSKQYTQYSTSGPYAAGTSELQVGSDRVVVWYPVTKTDVAGSSTYTYHLRTWIPTSISALIPSSFTDGVPEDAYQNAPMAQGPFPVVLFSHGFGGYPEQSSALTAHVATWGMIVVAPDQQSRDITAAIFGQSKEHPQQDVSEQLAALSYVEQQNSVTGSLFFGHVDTTKVATLGHSAGGGTAVRVANADPSVRGWIALAGESAPLSSKPVPSLMISGSLDKTVPTTYVRKFYGSVKGHKTLVVIDGYGHNVFDDVCTVNHAHGGITAAIHSLHLPVPAGIAQLATDGCEPPDAYPPTAWPLIDQAVVAQLRYDFGQNTSPVGLGAGLDNAFGHVHAHYTTSS